MSDATDQLVPVPYRAYGYIDPLSNDEPRLAVFIESWMQDQGTPNERRLHQFLVFRDQRWHNMSATDQDMRERIHPLARLENCCWRRVVCVSDAYNTRTTVG